MIKKLGALLLITAAAGLMLAASPASAGGGCHDDTMTDAAGTTVDLKNRCFYPTVLRVGTGETVTFTNADPDVHTVTGVAGSWGGYDELSQADSVAYTFDKSGVFPYFCLLHPSMAGAIVVGDGSSSATQAGAAADKVVSALAPGAEEGAASNPARDSDSGNGFSDYLLIAGIAVLTAAAGLGTGLVIRRSRG